jgi:hypothetical protein
MVTVGRVLEGAFALIREHWIAVAVWAGVYLVANVAMMATMLSVIGGPVMTGLDTTSPVVMAGAMSGAFLLYLLLLLVGAVLYTAGMRAVLRPQAGGLGFLRLGMDELRILVLVILFAVVFTAILVAAVMLLTLFTAGVAVSSESPAMAVLLSIVVFFAVFGLFLFLLVRLSLAFPLTLHRRQIVIGEAWTLSKGRFWTLFGAGLIVTLIGMMLSVFISAFAAGSYFMDLMAAGGDPEATARLAEEQMQNAATLSPALLLQSAASSVMGAIWIALSAGSAATAARLLLADEFDDAEEVFG